MKNLNNREIASFCSQVAMFQQAGITPVEGMRLLLSDAKTSEAKKIYEKIISTCMSGEPFYTGLESAEVFPEYVLHMAKLGEESGNLDDVMNSLASYYEREDEIADSIRSAISYPSIMIAMMFLVIIVLITKVLPIFNQVFIQLGSEMSGFSASLLKLGNQINTYSVVFLLLLILCVGLYFYATKTASGKRIVRKVLYKIPFTKKLYDNIAAGRFASGIALTTASGMDTYRSLDLVAQLVENDTIKEKIGICKKSLLNGSSFPEAIGECGIFSNFYTRMIAVGSKTGSTDTVMNKIADTYQKETTKKLADLISVLEPTLVIILSLIVGLILLSVILPLMGVMSSIG